MNLPSSPQLISFVQSKPTQFPSNPISISPNLNPNAAILEQQTISHIQKCNSTTSLSQLHAHIIKTNLQRSDPTLAAFFISCALSNDNSSNNGDDKKNIDYADLIFARIPNPSLFLCNTMIRAYAMVNTAHYSHKALLLYHQILHQPTIHPNNFTFPSLLKACAATSATEHGWAIHAQIIRHGLESDLHISAALTHMYAKCHHLIFARKLFDKMPQRDQVSWVTMIHACSEEEPAESLCLFRAMQLACIKPNVVAVVSVLTACANLGALEIGMWVHAYISKTKLDMNVKVATSLIDMYSKCGSIDLARQVFYKTDEKNLHVWTSMIVGLAMHGIGQEAFAVFDRMKMEKFEPDSLTFVGVLCACSHAGLVDEGRRFFHSMVNEYNIVPTREHYGCMVDLLGRKGLLDEAYQFIQEMEIEPNPIIWRALLGSCRVHRNVELGEIAAKVLFALEPEYDSNYLLLSNLYASTGRWDGVGKVRMMMKEMGIKKTPGSSSIEVNGSIHEFIVADRAHPQWDKVHKSLKSMIERLREVGYVPNTSEALLDLTETEKEQVLVCHSEKLAIAFGLISTNQGSKIRIMNNIRMCEDCHTVAKLVSKVFNREVLVRDCVRFHHFAKGSCSCKDYW